MHSLLTITWDMGRGLDLGVFTLRYYSLLFALGFVLGYLLMKRIFKKEGVPQEKLDTLLTYVVIATVVGARLGHVFFYQWDYYSQHPLEIFKVWEGGLASHGAAIAIIIAIVIYCKRELKKSSLWMLDRLVITIALAGALIRLGNWFNSEIYGDIANSSLETVYTNPSRERIMSAFDWISEVEFEYLNEKVETDTLAYPVYDLILKISNIQNFERDRIEQMLTGGSYSLRNILKSYERENLNLIVPASSEVRWDANDPNLARIKALGVPRHPTQLYEALGYFLIFLILLTLFRRGGFALNQGFLFGLFLLLIFGFRFFVEYLKEVQVSSEQGQSLYIGQWLSIPLVLAGLYFMMSAKKRKHE